MTFKDHDLTAPQDAPGIRYDTLPLRDPSGAEVPGLHVVHITLDNPGHTSNNVMLASGVGSGHFRRFTTHKRNTTFNTGVNHAIHNTLQAQESKRFFDDILSACSHSPAYVYVIR